MYKRISHHKKGHRANEWGIRFVDSLSVLRKHSISHRFLARLEVGGRPVSLCTSRCNGAPIPQKKIRQPESRSKKFFFVILKKYI